jgi:hypothetical protein
MTITELFGILTPILTVTVLIILVVLGVYAIGIVMRFKKILERVETLSDVAGWVQLLRKWPKRKSKDKE